MARNNSTAIPMLPEEYYFLGKTARHVCNVAVLISSFLPWHAVDLVYHWPFWRLGDMATVGARARPPLPPSPEEAKDAAADEAVKTLRSSIALETAANGKTTVRYIHGGEQSGLPPGARDDALLKKASGTKSEKGSPLLRNFLKERKGESCLKEYPFCLKRRWIGSTAVAVVPTQILSSVKEGFLFCEAFHVALNGPQWIICFDPGSTDDYKTIVRIRLHCKDGYSLGMGSVDRKVIPLSLSYINLAV